MYQKNVYRFTRSKVYCKKNQNSKGCSRLENKRKFLRWNIMKILNNISCLHSSMRKLVFSSYEWIVFIKCENVALKMCSEKFIMAENASILIWLCRLRTYINDNKWYKCRMIYVASGNLIKYVFFHFAERVEIVFLYNEIFFTSLLMLKK